MISGMPRDAQGCSGMFRGDLRDAQEVPSSSDLTDLAQPSSPLSQHSGDGGIPLQGGTGGTGVCGAGQEEQIWGLRSREVLLAAWEQSPSPCSCSWSPQLRLPLL